MTDYGADRLDRFRELCLRTVPAATALGGVVLLVAMQISWLDEPLDALGLSNSEAFRTTMIAVVLTAISGQLYELSQLARETAVEGRRHFRDTVDLFGFLSDRISAVERVEDRRADVLVAHLAGVLHFLSVIVQRPEVTNWAIRMTAMTARHDRSRFFVADDVVEQARRNVEIVRALAASPEFQDRGHTIEIHEYDIPPAFYGIKLGTGDLFICFLRWREDGRLNSFAGPFWEFIPRSEQTKNAESMRHLFDSWFQRAAYDTVTGRDPHSPHRDTDPRAPALVGNRLGESTHSQGHQNPL